MIPLEGAGPFNLGKSQWGSPQHSRASCDPIQILTWINSTGRQRGGNCKPALQLYCQFVVLVGSSGCEASGPFTAKSCSWAAGWHCAGRACDRSQCCKRMPSAAPVRNQLRREWEMLEQADHNSSLSNGNNGYCDIALQAQDSCSTLSARTDGVC